MATPALRALRQTFPTAIIHLLTTDWSAPALAGNPHIDATFRYPAELTAARYLVLARRLRDRQYDVGISLDRSPLVNGLLLLAGIPIRAGIDSSGRGVGLTHPVAPHPTQHETELYLAVVKTIGAQSDSVAPEYHPSERARARARRLLDEQATPIVIIHPGGAVNPGARFLSKRWPAINYGHLASTLIQNCSAHIVVIGTESDANHVQTTIDFTDGKVTDLSKSLSIDEVAAVCERAQLYVGNDSGMSHLAAAVGTPTVTIFGPTDPWRYRPLGPHAQVCAPAESSRLHGKLGDLRDGHWSVDHTLDISSVRVEEVANACERVLAQDRGTRQR